MSELRIELPTSETEMEALRPRLDAALKKEFPGGMLQRRWDGDVLRLSGPGAEGSIVLEEGRLVGQAELKPPASLMRPMIEQKIAAAMKQAAG
ncbi:MAG TPA: polyhydroxyalkanoic acid system family protein [Thermoanaerobaculia bacterium]|nr:polyhydroxyalkanoic acid system family protein [Thermoanaerobaculia bacterium]